MAHRVALVTYDATVHAWVLDLPGCVAGARDSSQLDAWLPLVIAGYEAWLRRHQEHVEFAQDWEIVERVDGRLVHPEFCFAAEKAPLPRDEFERMTSIMEFARADLLAAIAELPAALLDWAPPQATVEHADVWAPEVRTMRELLTHVLQLEVYYRDALHNGPGAGIFERVGDPGRERVQTLERLRGLSDAERSSVYLPVRPSRTEPDEWTVRKVVRRIVSHDRAHTAEIEQRRAWLLLGVPQFNQK